MTKVSDTNTPSVIVTNGDGTPVLFTPDEPELEAAEAVTDAAVDIAAIEAAARIEVATIEADTSLEHHRIEAERNADECQELRAQVANLTEQVSLLTTERDSLLLLIPPLLPEVSPEPETPLTEPEAIAPELAAESSESSEPQKLKRRVRFL